MFVVYESKRGIYLHAGCLRAANMTNILSRVDTSVRESLKGCFEGEGQKTVRDASCFRSTIARRNLLKMVKDERSCTSLPPGSFVRFPIKIPSGSTELVVHIYIYVCIRNRPVYICT